MTTLTKEEWNAEVRKAIKDVFKMDSLNTGWHGVKPNLEEEDQTEAVCVKYIWTATIHHHFREDVTLITIGIKDVDQILVKGLLLIPSVYGFSEAREYQSGTIKSIELAGKDLVADSLQNISLLPFNEGHRILYHGPVYHWFSIETYTSKSEARFSSHEVTDNESVERMWQALIATTKQFVELYNDPILDKFFENPPRGY